MQYGKLAEKEPFERQSRQVSSANEKFGIRNHNFPCQTKCCDKETKNAISSSKFIEVNIFLFRFRSGVIEEDQKKKSIFIK